MELQFVANLFFMKFRKKRLYWLKQTGVFFVGIALSAIIAWLNYLVVTDNDLKISALPMILACVQYVLMFIYTLFTMRFSYETDNFRLCFYMTASYAVKQFIFTVYLIILNFIDRSLIVYNYGQVTWLNLLIYALIGGLMLVAIYFLLIRKMTVVKKEDSFGNRILFLFLGAVLFITILNSVVESLSTNIEVRDLMYIYALIGQALCLVVITVTQLVVVAQIKTRNENKLIKYILSEREKEFKFAEATAELISIKAHDLKHQVAALRKGGEEAEKVLSEIEGVIQSYNTVVTTGNAVIDVILSEKWLYCDKHNIKLSCTVDPKVLDMLSQSDLYSLLGNILDNSIEAVAQIEDSNKRVISFKVFEKSGMAFVSTENYYEGQIKMNRDNLPYTSKKDKRDHGYGMKSIKMIIGKYDGSLNIDAKDNIFVLNIMIPIK